MRHTEDIIELILDANRNSLLGLDLRVSIATLGLTAGAMVAALFGMNVSSFPSLLPCRLSMSAVTTYRKLIFLPIARS